METSQASSSAPTTPITTSTTGIFGTKVPAAIAFLLVILLFLLPFAEVRCNNTPVANNTGLGLAIGSEWKEVVSKNIFGGSFETDKSGNKKDFNAQHDPNVFAIVALVLGIIGLLIAFLNSSGAGKINLFVGLLAAVSLIALLIDLKSKARSDTEIKSSNLDLNVGMKISVEGTAWFYLTVILFIIAAFFSWRRSK